MQHTVIVSSLCKWKRQKLLFLLFNGAQYAWPNMALSSKQSQNGYNLLYLFDNKNCKITGCLVATSTGIYGKNHSIIFWFSKVRPDIFNFSSFKNLDRIFQEMEKK